MGSVHPAIRRYRSDDSSLCCAIRSGAEAAILGHLQQSPALAFETVELCHCRLQEIFRIDADRPADGDRGTHSRGDERAFPSVGVGLVVRPPGIEVGWYDIGRFRIAPAGFLPDVGDALSRCNFQYLLADCHQVDHVSSGGLARRPGTLHIFLDSGQATKCFSGLADSFSIVEIGLLGADDDLIQMVLARIVLPDPHRVSVGSHHRLFVWQP